MSVSLLQYIHFFSKFEKKNKYILGCVLTNMISEPTMSSVTKYGSITVYCGPMYAGKTSELLREYSKLEKSGILPALVKHKSDIRYSTTHVRAHSPDLCNIADFIESTLEPIHTQLMERSHVFIDEGNFFPDVVEVCDSLANHGVHVYVSMLSGTFKLTPFKTTSRMLAICDRLVHLTANCSKCKVNSAPYSHKIAGNTEQIMDVGGQEKYIALCRMCFHKENEFTI